VKRGLTPRVFTHYYYDYEKNPNFVIIMSENSWSQSSFHRNKSKSDERHSSARFTQWEPTQETTFPLENTEQSHMRPRGHHSLEEMRKSYEEGTPPPPPLLHVDDLSRDSSSLLSTACSCGSPQKMQEVMKINHHWHMDYTSLLEDHRKLESDYWKTKSLLGKAEYEKDELTKKMTKLEKDISTMTTDQTSNKMEALKLQCSVFQEDFNAEREEREKYARETLKLKAELKKAYCVIDNLAVQVSVILNDSFFSCTNVENTKTFKHLDNFFTYAFIGTKLLFYLHCVHELTHISNNRQSH
jgi:hypothetical protein